MIRYLIGALILTFLAFLPFHLVRSPEGGKVKLIRVSPEDFQPVAGKHGGTLYFALSSDPKTLNPALAQETSSTAVIGDLFSGLTRLNLKTMEYEPDLALRWEVSQDGRVWTFYLRKDVRWSDGTPFTADDVVFTFNEVYYNESIPSSTGDILKVKGKKIKVEKIDDYTVRFTLPEPFAPFLGALTASILPKHKLQKHVREGTFNTAWNVNTDPKEIVGTGPWILEEYVKGQRVVYRPNPYYYRKDEFGNKLPYIKRKVGLIVGDPDTAILKFLNGEVDYVGLRPQDLRQMVGKENEGIKIYDLGSTPSTTFIVFNQNPNAKIPKYKLKWFQNRTFRVAISHAIDREGICNIVYEGFAKPLYGPITEANRPYYSEDLFPPYEYNLKKARTLLESIGFKDRDGDGILEDPEGHDLRFTLITNAGNKEREAIGNIVSADLKKIGVDVIFKPIDFNSLVSRLTSPPYEWEAVLIGLTGTLDPHFGRNVWHSSGVLHMWNPRQKKPATEWEAELDRLIDLGSSEMDPKKRVEIYRRAFRIIHREQPMIFIATPKEILAVKDKFGNLFPTVWGWYREEALFIK